MTRSELIHQIHSKKSMLCVGLDTDPSRIPASLRHEEDPVLAFNREIIKATSDYAVAYKINIAFYEAMGPKGWEALQATLSMIPEDCFTIADAKRGDIGNTAVQYAKTFYHTYPFHSVTVAPYMGKDSVEPFLQEAGKWAIILGLTSNAGSRDFQMLQTTGGRFLYEHVLETAAGWGTPENTMFVTGATQQVQMQAIRKLLPEHFFLVPGVGAQGGDVHTVCSRLMNADAGILINVSRGVIYADAGKHFAQAAGLAAKGFQQEMAAFL